MIRRSKSIKKEKYIPKPIVDNGQKNIYWEIRLVKRYPLLDNFHTTGIIGTCTQYIITAYLKFDEPKSEWFIKKLLRTQRYELGGFNINRNGYVVPIDYSIVSIKMINKEQFKEGTYFKSKDWTEYLTSPVRSLEEWSKIGNMEVMTVLQSGEESRYV